MAFKISEQLFKPVVTISAAGPVTAFVKRYGPPRQESGHRD